MTVKLKSRERLLLANVIGHVKLAMTAEDFTQVVLALNAAHMSLQNATLSVAEHPEIKAMKHAAALDLPPKPVVVTKP